jgi:hypothetical protein
MKHEYKEKLDKLKESLALDYKESQEFLKLTPKEQEIKLKKERKLWNLNSKERKKLIAENIYYGNMLDELIESQDVEVLRELLNLYTREEYCASELILESLPQGIMEYYPHKQITEVLCEKFDAIYDGGGGWSLKNMLMHLWEEYLRWPVGRWPVGAKGIAIREESCFPEFRQIFNATRPRNAERFLKEMEEWCDEPEEKAMLQTLKQDMAKW